VRSEKRSETTLSGVVHSSCFNNRRRGTHGFLEGRLPPIVASRNGFGKTCLFVCWMRSSGETRVSTENYPLRSKPTVVVLDRQESQQLAFTYVQGMNVLAAPFLYTMPSELEAFFCFSKFIEQSCPLYVQPTLEGVHRGLSVRHRPDHDVLSSKQACQLLDRCLDIVDPELYARLRSKNLSAEIYAFPCLSLFSVRFISEYLNMIQPCSHCVLAHHLLIKCFDYGIFFLPSVST